MTTKPPDGKHPRQCASCGALTWRQSQTCRRCAGATYFDPARFSEEQLDLCVKELLRRHKERGRMLRELLDSEAA